MGTGWMCHCQCLGHHEPSLLPLLMVAGVGAVLLAAALAMRFLIRKEDS